MSEPFKICTTCGKIWKTMDSFLSDPEVQMNGYQVHFDDLKGGLFFFTHHHKSCYTTLAIPVTAFSSLNDRPLLATRDEQQCHGSDFCVRQGALSSKPVKCECAWVHEIIQIIQNWNKTKS